MGRHLPEAMLGLSGELSLLTSQTESPVLHSPPSALTASQAGAPQAQKPLPWKGLQDLAAYPGLVYSLPSRSLTFLWAEKISSSWLYTVRDVQQEPQVSVGSQRHFCPQGPHRSSAGGPSRKGGQAENSWQVHLVSSALF